MTEKNIVLELAQRTEGSCMVGVVGPVRTGKSTFIKRFMETLVIPAISDAYSRERAKDELPQSGSGRSIMTAEPKFVPEEPISIALGGESYLRVRLVDCVGYMVQGAAGQEEDGQERMVTTPWFDHEVTMTEAAETGTALVIQKHADLGVVVTTDGSICDLPRSAYLEPEGRVIRELQKLGKPFVVIMNSAKPDSDEARQAAESIQKNYGVSCFSVNCQSMQEEDICSILRLALEDFPLRSLQFHLPDWLVALPGEDELKQRLYAAILQAGEGAIRLRDRELVLDRLGREEMISSVRTIREDLGQGTAEIEVMLPRSLYYALLSERSGIPIQNDGELIACMSQLRDVKSEYDRLRDALVSVQETGYGVVYPSPEEMQLEEPQIVQKGGKYAVKLHASAPAIHMLRTQVDCEVNPAIGGDGASEEILGFLLQGFEGDVNRIWESKIFGRSLNDLAEESLKARVMALPDQVRDRLRQTLQRMINEQSNGLICILL